MVHEAVVVFLSCLALLFPTSFMSEKKGALKCTVSRLGRIYSVALPALLLTLLLYYLGVAITEDAYKDLNSNLNDPSWTIVSALLFLLSSLVLMGPSIILYLLICLLGLMCFKLFVSQKISLGCSAILFLMSIFGFSILLRGKA